MMEVTKKKIDKEVRNNRLLKIILIVIIIITLFISLFVLINESKNKNYNDGYTIMINYSDYEEHDLKLGFDPTFDTYYNKLVGLGYGTVNSNIGGSLLENVEMNLTMFEKFNSVIKGEKIPLFDRNENTEKFDQYYCNKYYIKNIGNHDKYFRLNLKITKNIKNALGAARFMIATGDNATGFKYNVLSVSGDGEKEVVASKNVVESDYIGPLYITDPNKNNNNLLTKKIEDAWFCEPLLFDAKTGFFHYYSMIDNEDDLYVLKPNETMAFTICFWLEASDKEHQNEIIGGSVSFSVIYETLDYMLEKNNK